LVKAGQTQNRRCENEMEKRNKTWEKKISVKHREREDWNKHSHKSKRGRRV